MGLYRPRSYDFKAKDSDELEGLDIAFAIKEYLQNSVGQILKALQVRIWRNWYREDLSADTLENVQKRRRCKEKLVTEEAQIFAGDQGRFLKRCPSARPWYVLKKHIAASELRGESRQHDLRVVVVLWKFPNATAMTIYNNYLDEHASFDHFVYDGASTSKHSEWAVGLKGRGFILATSFLAQACESAANTSIDRKHIGVGFNVGSRLCRARYDNRDPDVLKVKREDLRPLTLEAFKKESRYTPRKVSFGEI